MPTALHCPRWNTAAAWALCFVTLPGRANIAVLAASSNVINAAYLAHTLHVVETVAEGSTWSAMVIWPLYRKHREWPWQPCTEGTC